MKNAFHSLFVGLVRLDEVPGKETKRHGQNGGHMGREDTLEGTDEKAQARGTCRIGKAKRERQGVKARTP